MRIRITNSVFHFNAIKQIINELNLAPSNHHQNSIFKLIDPLNENYEKIETNIIKQKIAPKTSRKNEVERRLIRLAYFTSKKIKKLNIDLLFPISIVPNQELLFFIHYLKAFNKKNKISISYSPTTSIKCSDSCLEKKLINLSKNDDKQIAEILNTCALIINAGDYYSPVNILNYIKSAEITTNTDVINQLEKIKAICSEIICNKAEANF